MDDFDHDPSSWDAVTSRAAGRHGESTTYGRSHRTEDGRQLFVGVQVQRDVGKDREVITTGKVEVNPSRVVDPEGWGLAGVEAVPEAVAFAAGTAGRWVVPGDEVVGWDVTRIDVARDFAGVANPSRLLRGLAPIHRPYAKRNLVHADPSRSGAQTLMVGSGAGVVRAYDKAAETKGRAPQGSLRWEAEARRGWAERFGLIEKLSDVTRASVLELACNRWNWSSMGAEVGATSRVAQRVAGLDWLTEREKALVVGWLVLAAADCAWEVGSKSTLAKFRRVQRDLGIALSPEDLEDEGDGLVSRLDFATGREVVRAA